MFVPQAGVLLAGRYRIERKLGQGGMGSVYAATDQALHRTVAIKLLHTSDPEQLSRFALEARAIASLGHTNVGAVIDFHAAADPVPFLAMELIEGDSLRGLLARERTLAPARAVYIAQQMLAGLGAAHAAGTIHRDVKPSNVMLVQAGVVADLVKLVDFGVAKMAEGTTRRHQTAQGAVVGTPQYMPPEQAMGMPVGPSADLYAVGVCLFEMLAGYNPFAVGDVGAVLGAVRDLVPPSLAQVRPDVPPVLAECVARALAKDPRARFGSAAELSHALAAALAPATLAGNLPPPSAFHAPPSMVTQAPLLQAAPAAGNRSLLIALLVIGGLLLVLVVGGGVAGALYFHASAGSEPALDAGPPPVTSAPAAVGSTVAPVASAASAPATEPKAKAKPAAVEPVGKADCICSPDRADTGDTQPLCKAISATPDCKCRSVADQYEFCAVPFAANGNCPLATYGKPVPWPGGKQGGACEGYNSNARKSTTKDKGTLTCRLCPEVWFTGVEGNSCRGFHVETGKPYGGKLSCGRR